MSKPNGQLNGQLVCKLPFQKQALSKQFQGVFMKREFVIYKRKRSKRKYWYFYFYDEYGNRHYRSTGETVEAKAIAYVNEKYRNGTLFEKTYVNTKFKEFSKPFWIPETCPIVKSKIKRGGTITKGYCKQCRQLIENHLIPAFGKMALGQISPDKIEQWLLDLPEKKQINNKTANKALLVLRQMLDIAVKQKIIPYNPCHSVKPLIEHDSRRSAFTTEEVKTILTYKWDNEAARVACLLSATTGMRMGEIRALTVEHIHPDYIEVCQAWAEHDGLKSTKSGKDRDIPIENDLYRILMNIAPMESGYIFTYNLNKPVDSQFITLRLKKVMEAVGIDWRKKNLSFHSFRHYFNTRLVAAGIGDELVRAVVGHESSEMTQHYLHLKTEDMNFVRQVSSELISSCL